MTNIFLKFKMNNKYSKEVGVIRFRGQGKRRMARSEIYAKSISFASPHFLIFISNDRNDIMLKG